MEDKTESHDVIGGLGVNVDYLPSNVFEFMPRRGRSKQSFLRNTRCNHVVGHNHGATAIFSRDLRMALLLLAVLSTGVFVGYSIGILTAMETPSCQQAEVTTPTVAAVKFNWGDRVNISGEEVEVINWFDDIITADNINNNLITLTAKPHIAGGTDDHDLADLIYKQWSSYNFDKVEMVNYSVLVSYPNSSAPSVLNLMRGSEVIYTAHTKQEPPLTPGEDDGDVVPPYVAYSGNGTVKGPLVYVNYGQVEDFFYLTRNLSLNLSNHICIARYGVIFRGDKALQAQKFNCSGLLIYSDPKDYAPPGVAVYPNGPSLPPGGVQRGSLLRKEGDPLTPGVPSLDGFYRQPYSEVEDSGYVPRIPVQPISYEDAIHFMSQLDDITAPSDWVGGLNITYKIAQSYNNTKYTLLEVNGILQQKIIYNVIGKIYGGVETDRLVILGNHRDAWVFGAADPNSGTAVMMELARALSELRAIGWRPGRSVMLCSWDAEEMAMFGSTEFLEDKRKLLEENTVAYLNVDIALAGTKYLGVGSTPLIFQTMWDATQLVKSPDPSFKTVYDQWLSEFSKSYNGTIKPQIFNLGSGSDYVMYLQELGITCSDMAYANSTAGRYAYQVYHSVHDNYYWMSHFGDPSFSHHLALGLVWIKVAVMLSTQPILNFDPRDYAIVVRDIYNGVEVTYGQLLNDQGISLEYLRGAVDEFTDACVDFHATIEKVVAKVDVYSNENVVRIINDKLMNIERAFIHDDGLPGRSYFKHILFAPSSVNSYGSSLFPGVSDTIFNAVNFGGSWDDVRRQLDFVRTHIRFATEIMNEPSLDFPPMN